MVVRKEKKVGRYRGQSTHGGGHRKKRRGGGSRGGRGLAGTGKKSGHLKIRHRLGRTGFTSKRRAAAPVTINVGFFTKDKVAHLVQEGKATKEKDMYVVNLSQLGYGKLLGTGSTSLKLKLIVDSYSAQAEQKITAAGGSIISSAVAETAA